MAVVRPRARARTAGWTAWLGAISAMRRASFRSWLRSAAGELKEGLGGGVQGGARTTEWWYANAVDTRSGLAVALSVGPEAAGASPASVAFLYLPDGRTFTVAAPRLSGPTLGRSAEGGPDVRLGPDRFVETAP